MGTVGLVLLRSKFGHVDVEEMLDDEELFTIVSPQGREGPLEGVGLSPTAGLSPAGDLTADDMGFGYNEQVTAVTLNFEKTVLWWNCACLTSDPVYAVGMRE